MKRFIFCLMLLPALASCVDSDGGFSGNTEIVVMRPTDINGFGGLVTLKELPEGSTEVRVQLDRPVSQAYAVLRLNRQNGAQPGAEVLGLASFAKGQQDALLELPILQSPATSFAALATADLFIGLYDPDENLLAFADLGINSLTGNQKIYPLEERGGLGVFGNVTLFERKSGFTLLELRVIGTSPNGFHPAHLHQGNLLDGDDAPMLQMLNPVNGTTGFGMTSVSAYGATNIPVTYLGLLQLDAHIKVHLSDADKTVLCSGNIGANF